MNEKKMWKTYSVINILSWILFRELFNLDIELCGFHIYFNWFFPAICIDVFANHTWNNQNKNLKLFFISLCESDTISPLLFIRFVNYVKFMNFLYPLWFHLRVKYDNRGDCFFIVYILDIKKLFCVHLVFFWSTRLVRNIIIICV